MAFHEGSYVSSRFIAPVSGSYQMPVRMRKSETPREYRSDFSVASSPRFTSGAM